MGGSVQGSMGMKLGAGKDGGHHDCKNGRQQVRMCVMDASSHTKIQNQYNACNEEDTRAAKRCDDSGVALWTCVTGAGRAYHGLLAVLREAENGVGILVVQVIKEDAATASALVVAVFDHKIVVTPFLELGPVLRIMLVAHSLNSSRLPSGQTALLTQHMTMNTFLHALLRHGVACIICDK